MMTRQPHLSSRPTPDLIRGRAETQFGVCAIEVMGPGTPTSRARDVSGRVDSNWSELIAYMARLK